MRSLKFTLLILQITVTVFITNSIFAQQKITLTGRVLSSVSGKPVEFASVTILEERVKTRSDQKGVYSIPVSKPGTYTIIIRAQGLKALNTKMTIRKNIKRDFYLRPFTIKGPDITVTDDRYFQKVSRRKMTRDDLKSTPASFGDAINALTSLPGIDRTDGFFGPLVIRGMFPRNNRYFVDGMPINNPMHFGGLHSVINTNLMDEINLYSSSFPARFGGAMAAVIDITTIDNVKEEGGFVDTGIISTNILYKRPFTKTVTDEEGNKKTENTGYVIASGRYGYLGFIIPFLYEQIYGRESIIVPEYYDYQLKMKKIINSKHSLSLLFLGSKDYFRFISGEDQFDEEADPLFNDLRFESNEMFHNLGLYHNYHGGRMRNRLMAYASITQYDFYINSNQVSSKTPDWIEDLRSESKPYIFGAKNTIDIEWIKDHADLKMEAEYALYYFRANGETLTVTSDNGGDAGFEEIAAIPLDVSSVNHSVGGFAENRFILGGLTFVPGIRSDYFHRTGQSTLDPRGMVSYEFETDTTVSAASGQYSAFFQLNPFLFNFRPDLSQMEEDAIEKAWHNVVGIEQSIGLYTIGIEGYYNYFQNMAEEYPHYVDGEFREGQMTGSVKVYGFEILLRKDKRKGRSGAFGWMSYTYSQSKHKTGITGNAYDEDGNDTGVPYDNTGDKWVNSEFDRNHALKLVAGYTFNKITLSCKYQYLSSFPYTDIVGSQEDPDYPGRYVPIYDVENKYTERYPAYQRFDIRFEYKTRYEFGYVSWYIEIINVFMEEEVEQNWKYNQPYSSSNPETKADEGGLTIIPNFGVEIKF